MTPNDYRNLWDTCQLTVDPLKLKTLDSVCRIALTNQVSYQVVQVKTGVPWPILAGIHFRESDQSFKKHLHNGDPLTARTVHVPAGRPTMGEPPFRWIDSAIDALSDRHMPTLWDTPSCLEFLERYNGTGYQKRSVNTPYLWDYTDQYATGLYIADGSFDSEKQENRPGVVAILKTLAQMGVSLDFTSLSGASSSGV